MKHSFAAAVIALCAAYPAAAGEWTERYFGVGSDGDRGAACSQARDHAQGNSFRACMDRRGTREGTSYTECLCTQSDETLHICNVNLKVLCVGSLASSGGASGSPALKGGPKGRADRRRDAHSGARRVVSDRPGPAVPAKAAKARPS
ncbi:MAG TPA: hypothetical protein VI356_07735 [Myxococcales bacterium]